MGLSASVGIPTGDSIAPGTWVAREDSLGWFTSGSPSYITVGLDGYYQLTYHSTAGELASGATAASKILRNGTVVSCLSVASDLVVSSGAVEGCVQNCFRPRIQLAVGDKIYWNNYVSTIGATLGASSLTAASSTSLGFSSRTAETGGHLRHDHVEFVEKLSRLRRERINLFRLVLTGNAFVVGLPWGHWEPRWLGSAPGGSGSSAGAPGFKVAWHTQLLRHSNRCSSFVVPGGREGKSRPPDLAVQGDR
ncbi:MULTISPECIES: hypothetical protein [unclassified Amycolatopsis]|uniref:hypothetical protein n=1 Tax=unclassified Amycolatopsis TaxID=2618356 RepID=UPI001C6A0415|nr:hypothetical protein [Amycolatopsis sp. DSM 110486]QYN19017.1 hypothetical protein K1T34_41080 [Amycolatopsis sp. DSM 110486]